MTGVPSIPGIERSLLAYTTNDISRVKLYACFERIKKQIKEKNIQVTKSKNKHIQVYENWKLTSYKHA